MPRGKRKVAAVKKAPSSTAPAAASAPQPPTAAPGEEVDATERDGKHVKSHDPIIEMEVACGGSLFLCYGFLLYSFVMYICMHTYIRMYIVLLGRGKRISEWPGNVHFRQVVNRYRDEYGQAGRKEKVKIAARVLQDVAAAGGRVLAQNDNGGGDKWQVVERERAVEKACQALREKEKSRPPEASPFEGLGNDKAAATPPRAPPTGRSAAAAAAGGSKSDKRSAKPKRGRASAPASANKNKPTNGSRPSKKKKTHGDDNGGGKKKRSDDIYDDEDDDAEEKASSDEIEEDEEEDEEEKVTVARLTASIAKLRELPNEEMITRLEAFKERHGHCTVPPFDSLLDPACESRDGEFVVLADWCTVQRQIRHEIECRYRKPTKKEKDLIAKLTDMGFCWDFESWHWDESFAILQQELKHAAESKMGLSDEALDWLRDQRRRGKRGAFQSHPERVQKLKTAGVWTV